MKKFVLCLFAISLGACSCPSERKAISDIEATHAIILPQYVSYVEKDSSLSSSQKEDRKKLVESLKRLVESLRSTGE